MFEETCESFLGLRARRRQENPMPFLRDFMTKMDLGDTEASAYVIRTFLLPLLCVFKIASPWCLGACSLPQRPLRWHTWNRCSKGEDLGIEAVNGEPSIHAYPSFSTDAWSYTSTVLFYSCPEFLIKFKHQRHQRQDHDPSQHLS